MRTCALILAALTAAACTRTFRSEVVEPNPIAHPLDTLRVSEPVRIVTSDMDLEVPVAPNGPGTASSTYLEHYPLVNVARFFVVSRDRLRFHVQIDHKWDDYADLRTWKVELVDDRGRRWTPEAVEHVHRRLITRMWDQEQRTAMCGAGGHDVNGNCYTTIGFYDDGWRNRIPLGSLTVYRGTADFVFYERDLMTASVRWLKLVVKRRGQAFEFTWRFEDQVAAR